MSLIQVTRFHSRQKHTNNEPFANVQRTAIAGIQCEARLHAVVCIFTGISHNNSRLRRLSVLPPFYLGPFTTKLSFLAVGVVNFNGIADIAYYQGVWYIVLSHRANSSLNRSSRVSRIFAHSSSGYSNGGAPCKTYWEQ